MKEIQRLEVGVDVGIDTKHQTLAGVAFPLTSKASEALQLFAKGKLQYVQLKIGKIRKDRAFIIFTIIITRYHNIQLYHLATPQMKI